MMMLLLLAAAAAAPGDGKTMAMDDWQALSITGVAPQDKPGDPLFLRVAAADLDGDGTADVAVMRLACDGDLLQQASILTAREAGSGMATGKRMHKPWTITTEWGAASPQLSAMKPSSNIQMMKGTRLAADADGWQKITLSNADGLCPAAASSAVATSKSNVKNN